MDRSCTQQLRTLRHTSEWIPGNCQVRPFCSPAGPHPLFLSRYGIPWIRTCEGSPVLCTERACGLPGHMLLKSEPKERLPSLPVLPRREQQQAALPYAPQERRMLPACHLLSSAQLCPRRLRRADRMSQEAADIHLAAFPAVEYRKLKCPWLFYLATFL